MTHRPYDRTFIVLSALVYPGSGQLLQRRWGPATFFVVTFSVLLYFLFGESFTPIIANWDVVFRWAEAQETRPFQQVSLSRVLLLLTLLLLVYFANPADMVRAQHK